MSWVTKKIYDFLMDLIGDVIGTFSDLIMDLYSGRVSEIVSSSQVLGAVMVTTGIATTLVSFMVIKQLFCIYILETEGDAEADPLQQLVKATVAIALIQTNSVVLSALLRYAALFGTEVLAGSGMVRDNLSSEHLMEALSNTGISLIVAAIFLVIFAAGAILVMFKACLRTVELAIMEILYPIFCIDILSIQQEKWKSFVSSYLITIFGYIVQILSFMLALTYGIMSGGLGGFFIALAFLFFAVKAPNWLEKYVYSSGAGKTTAGMVRSAGQMLMMKKMYQR